MEVLLYILLSTVFVFWLYQELRRYIIYRKYKYGHNLKMKDRIFLHNLRKVMPKRYKVIYQVKVIDIAKLGKVNLKLEEGVELAHRFKKRKHYRIDFVILNRMNRLKFVVNLENPENHNSPKLYSETERVEQLLRLIGVEVIDFDYAESYDLKAVADKLEK